MEEKHRKVLFKNAKLLRERMEVKKLLPWLSAADILDEQDLADINAEQTTFTMVDKLIDILRRAGPAAFNKFLQSLNEIQPHLAGPLAQEAGVVLEEKPKNLEEEKLKLLTEKKLVLLEIDADKILPLVEGLDQDDRERISSQATNQDKNQILLSMLPRRSPSTLSSYFAAVKKVDPKRAAVVSPCEKLETQVSVGSGVSNVTVDHQTALKDVPYNRLVPHLEELNKEHMLGDWRDIYKELDLPPRIMDSVAAKDSPVETTLTLWMDSKGTKATIGNLLSALVKCHRGAIADKVREEFGINTNVDDLIVSLDGVDIDKSMKPVQFVSELSEWDRKDLAEKLNGTAGKYQEMCHQLRLDKKPQDAVEFITVCGSCRMREFFKVLRKCGFKDAAVWIRTKVPAGSTGPLQHEEDLYVRNMNYGARNKIVQIISGYNNGSWEKFAETIGLDQTTILCLQAMKGVAPMDEVLKTYSSRAGSTVGNLYDVFVKCKLEILADEL